MSSAIRMVRYLKDLADKTRRGLRGRVEAGKSGGGNSYGYDVVAMVNDAKEPIRGERTINSTEAGIVRCIFNEYAAGKSPKAIALALNKVRVPGPSGKGWGPSTINGNWRRGTGILNNELYIGRLIWNRLSYIKNPETGNRVSRLNPEAEWIVKDVPALRIIDQELWDQVKARQQGLRKLPAFHEKQRPRMLLSYLLVEEFCDEYTCYLNKLRSEKNAHLAAAKGELAKLGKERENLIQAIKDGVPASEVKDDLVRVVDLSPINSASCSHSG